jgi:hypothetical protein
VKQALCAKSLIDVFQEDGVGADDGGVGLEAIELLGAGTPRPIFGQPALSASLRTHKDQTAGRPVRPIRKSHLGLGIPGPGDKRAPG